MLGLNISADGKLFGFAQFDDGQKTGAEIISLNLDETGRETIFRMEDETCDIPFLMLYNDSLYFTQSKCLLKVDIRSKKVISLTDDIGESHHGKVNVDVEHERFFYVNNRGRSFMYFL